MLNSSWCPIILATVFVVAILSELFIQPKNTAVASYSFYSSPNNEWEAPNLEDLSQGPDGDLIRYGYNLISNTGYYLGPKGLIAQISNGMNCQNCHIDAGRKAFGGSFSAVASTYPKFRPRSGKMETVEFRVNECMERSMNGHTLAENSEEMKAMVAYLKWVGKDVPKDVKPKGSEIPEISLLKRPADPVRGKTIYLAKCQRCHGLEGQGVLRDNVYLYPPLWGDNSYNVSAGMYRMSRIAGFVKHNMPFDSAALGYKISDEDAWDVGAYINSQPRPGKRFSYDWPDISKKPYDHPFGPYTDGFSELQHKYGPYAPIKEKIKSMRK